MNVFKNATIQEAQLTLIPVNIKYLSGVGVRLSIWSPPSSLTLTLITYYNFVAWLDALVATKAVLQTGAFSLASRSHPKTRTRICR